MNNIADVNRFDDDESKENMESDVETYTRRAYDFFTDPNSKYYGAFRWSLFTNFLVVLNIIFILLETVDGPNHYSEADADMATYPSLPTKKGYTIIYALLWIPLCFDALFRVIVVAVICFYPENEELYHEITDNFFTSTSIMFFCDIICIIPFIIRVAYIAPSDLSQFPRLLLRVLDLLSTVKIFRAIKDIGVIHCLQLTISNSMPHLFLPIFFFFLFNIFFGVVMYFIEPCYDYRSCPWTDVFESCFFSVVTMTTTGYGNQTPVFLPGRLVACLIMLFGSLFLSMPLAIIGNEYESASRDLNVRNTSELALKSAVAQAQAQAHGSAPTKSTVTVRKHITIMGSSAPSSISVSGTSSGVPGMSGPAGEEGGDAARKVSGAVMRNQITETKNQLMKPLRALRSQIGNQPKMSPSMLLLVCEVKGWLAPFQWAVQSAMEMVVDEKKEIRGRKLSLFRQSTSSFSNDTNALNSRLTQVAPDTSSSLTPTPGLNEHEKIPRTDSVVSKMGVLTFTSASQVLGQISKLFNDDDDDDDEDSDEDLSGGGGTIAFPRAGRNTLEGGRSAAVGPFSPASEGRRSMAGGGGSLTSLPSLSERNGGAVKENDEDEGEGGDSDSERDRSEVDDKVSQVSPQENVSRSVKGGAARFKAAAKTVASVSHVVSLKRTFTQTFIVDAVKQVGSENYEFLRNKSKKVDGERFDSQMKYALKHPHYLRTHIWLLMEFPDSSRWARIYQIIIFAMVLLSVLMFYTQTLTSFTQYSESAPICGEVLSIYCSNKNSVSYDPGCFVQSRNATTDRKMRFDCDDDDCFAHGYNFGAVGSNMTCNTNKVGAVTPFEDQHSLATRFKRPGMVVNRDEMHKIMDVCGRIECNFNDEMIGDGNKAWLPLEFLTNIAFTLEILFRLFSLCSLKYFFYDYMNLIDCLSIVPFYSEIFSSIGKGSSFSEISFAIVSSSPQPILLVALKSLKVFRIFKTTRQYSGSKIIIQTAYAAYKQIIGIISLLIFIVIVFAILLFEVEQGNSCFYGVDCPSFADEQDYKVGQRVLVDKNGDVTQFANVLDGLWFSMVTLTTTGYGDKNPVTNIGQLMSIFLMLFGIIYMAMPLSATASSFWKVHCKHKEQDQKLVGKQVVSERKIVRLDDYNSTRIRQMEAELNNFSTKLAKFLEDIQTPNVSAVANKLTIFERCVELELELRKCLENYDADIFQLSEVYIIFVMSKVRGQT